MKKAMIVVSYHDECDLNTFLSTNNTNLEIYNTYEDLNEEDVRFIENVMKKNLIEENLIEEKKLCEECQNKQSKRTNKLSFLEMCDWCKANYYSRTRR